MNAPAITRQGVLDLLNGDWAQYVPRFQALPPAARSAFLEKQGYPRLADLLGHIVAWWEVGMQVIRTCRIDPAARQPEMDVDAFNARAVEQVRSVSDDEEIVVFEAARRKFLFLVDELSKKDFADERILNQIRWELVNHLDDHKLP